MATKSVKATKSVELKPEHTGCALVNLIGSLVFTETKIGQYGSREIGGANDMIVSGHIIFDTEVDIRKREAPGSIYTSLNGLAIDKTPIISGLSDIGIGLDKLIDMGCSKLKLDESTTKTIKDKVHNLNKKKLLVIPIKPKAKFRVNYVGDFGNLLHGIGDLTSLKWLTNKKTAKLELTAKFTIPDDYRPRTVNLPITDYLVNYTPEKMKYWNGLSKSDLDILKMSSDGLIHPVEFKDKGISVVFDGSYVYWINEFGNLFVAGEWNRTTGALVLTTDLIQKIKGTKLFDIIRRNVIILSGHRNLIAPYRCYPLHVVSVDDMETDLEKENRLSKSNER